MTLSPLRLANLEELLLESLPWNDGQKCQLCVPPPFEKGMDNAPPAHFPGSGPRPRLANTIFKKGKTNCLFH